MHSKIKTLVYEAEERYLQTPDLQSFRNHITSLAQRLETYKYLREQEIAIFQPVANELFEAFPQEDKQRLERALYHWLAILRYCAMAMLLNDPAFLQNRLLEWLTEIVQIHQIETIERKLFQCLHDKLQQMLTVEQLELLQPFLEQAQDSLLQTEAASAV